MIVPVAEEVPFGLAVVRFAMIGSMEVSSRYSDVSECAASPVAVPAAALIDVASAVRPA